MKKQRKRQDSLFNGLNRFTPLTENQAQAKIDFDSGYNLGLFGYAGTGKTFMACAFALELLAKSKIHRVIIYRSAVASRDMGFLKGSAEEKMAVYEKPYIRLFNQILKRDDAYGILKSHRFVEFDSTSFLRGITLEDCVVIVDECQNMSEGELNTLMTRLGNNARIIFCGDTNQRDISSRESGIATLKKCLTLMEKHFKLLVMDVSDIVRSPLVRDWIIAYNEVKEV